QHIIALGALKFQRPVKITLSRAESLQVAQKKHPSEFNVKLGLDGTGRFKALVADIVTDKGAYATLGFDIIENMMAFIGGSYYIPTVLVNGRSVYTHNVMSGAMRGFGANQSNFVIESLVDVAARKTGLNPFEIRLINALKPGLPTITDHVLEPGIPGVVEVLEAARAAVERECVPEVPEGMVPGFGIACGVKNVGFGHSLPESAGARVVLSSEGNCRLFVTHHEYGQGAVIGEARIASEVLGIPIDRISVNEPDTKLTPYTGASTASRQTFLSGNATVGACNNLLSDLLIRASGRMGILDPAPLAIEGDMIVEKGGDRQILLSDLGEDFQAEFRFMAPETDGFPEGSQHLFGSPEFKSRRTHWAYAYGAQAAWVAIDEKTGNVSVLKIVTVSDVGKVLNRRAVEGQQDGGVMMGVGYALSEEFIVKNGRNITRDLRGSGIPKAGDTPEIVNIIVEVPHPGGPLGAKGFAEAPSLATAPAVANAIYDAVGVRMYKLPMTPERVKGAMDIKSRS
ncbi:MAG: molybdopterin-dependent oxidoreductase, partial [Spirochaetaceae bacterium]|nr:molybdopterin-dependent oxidoreductase [Spirochaetaceae bacterium]